MHGAEFYSAPCVFLDFPLHNLYKNCIMHTIMQGEYPAYFGNFT